MCKKLIYLIPVIFALSLCLISSAQAQNIVWCSEDLDVDQDDVVDDWEWIELLESVGYTVYSEPGIWAALDDAHIELLNNADLIIFSRGSNSGGYNQAGEPEQWNSIDVPMILMNAYITRNTRWFWIDSDVMIERAASPWLEALDVTHPIFQGIELDENNRVQVFDPNVDTGEITFIGTTEVGNGSLIAKAVDEDWAFIVEWEPDIEFYEGSGQVPAARRMLFTAGIHPETGGYGGRYSQTEEGRQLFLNAINYMLDAPPRIKAYVPNPTPGNIEAPQDVVLSWNAGVYADTHNVYFGTVFEDVDEAGVSDPRNVLVSENQAETTYQVPESLVFGHTYYWRVDEVNAPPDSSIIKGDVWTFTVVNFHVVDDFEDYNDYPPDRIFDTWIDGWGTTTNGATAGYPEPDFTAGEHFIETEFVHAGEQSLPYFYDNDMKYSEAKRPLADEARDWTRDGVQELSLWFRGYLPEVGSFTEDPAGTFTMTATGADIWDDSDEFHFAYRELSGAGSITAKVESVANTNDWAKAGIMIRDTLEPDSPHVMMVVAPNQAVSFQYRRSAGGASEDITEADHPAPLWLKLDRDIAGNITASYSADGSSWTQLTSDRVNMGLPLYVGLVVTSHDNSRVCEAVFSNVSITGTVTDQWVNQDIGTLSNSHQPIYVAVSNSTGDPVVAYNEDTSATVIPTWTEFVVPLQDFADQGIDLTDVDSVAIGVGTRGDTATMGGLGKMYFDDIRLYLPRAPERPEPVDPGTDNLVHSYTFEDGTANDSVGSAHGTLVGGAAVVDGAMVTTAQDQWMEMPGDVIAINTFDEVTVEAWYTPTVGANTSWTMLAYFGDSTDPDPSAGLGNNGFFITSARGDDKSRAAISVGEDAEPWGAETGADGPEYDDGNLHHMVSTINATEITLYIDGVLYMTTPLAAHNSIAGLSNNLAYLAKGGYGSDPEWIGAIHEFNIYNRALSEAEVRYLAEN